MQNAHETHARKKTTTLSINADLLSNTRSMNINISATLEQNLLEALERPQREQWLAENRAAIEACNDHVDQHGVFSDGMRTF